MPDVSSLNRITPGNLAARPSASAPATSAEPVKLQGDSRLVQQQRYVASMWQQLGRDAQLASVMLNPLFMVQAQAITSAAVAEAVRRYEVEVPQKDFSVLYAQEMERAHGAILALPGLYAEYGEQALQATGQALLGAYDATTDAVATAAEATGTFAKNTAVGVVGALESAGKGLLHGLGKLINAFGSIFTTAGQALEKVGN